MLVTVILSHLLSIQECSGEGLGYPHLDKQSPALARLGLLPPQGRGWCSPPSLSKPELVTWLPWGELPHAHLRAGPSHCSPLSPGCTSGCCLRWPRTPSRRTARQSQRRKVLGMGLLSWGGSGTGWHGASHREPSPPSSHGPICSGGSLCFVAVRISQSISACCL